MYIPIRQGILPLINLYILLYGDYSPSFFQTAMIEECDNSGSTTAYQIAAMMYAGE
jgi:hypothetical protein